MSLRDLKPEEIIQLGDTARMAQGDGLYARITTAWGAAWVGKTVAEYARWSDRPAEGLVRRMEPDEPKSVWGVE